MGQTGWGLAVWAFSICWKTMARTIQRQMLICHKVTHNSVKLF